MTTKRSNQAEALHEENWGSKKEVNANQQPANDFYYPYHETAPYSPTNPLNRVSTNKLLARKRKRSRHPLRDLRLQRGFTLEELANLTKLSPSYLSRLESGTRRLNADILDKLAHVLSCHPGALLPMDSHGPKFNMSLSRPNSDFQEGIGEVKFQYNAPDLPLYSIRLANNQGGNIELETPVEWVNRPSELMGVPGAIAFQINNQVPGCRYRPGDRVFAHPARPLSSNCSVLAVTYNNTAYIGEFMGWSEQAGVSNVLNLRFPENNNPEEHLKLSGDTLKSVYRIIGLLEAV